LIDFPSSPFRRVQRKVNVLALARIAFRLWNEGDPDGTGAIRVKWRAQNILDDAAAPFHSAWPPT
jgi:hypothetical protein